MFFLNKKLIAAIVLLSLLLSFISLPFLLARQAEAQDNPIKERTIIATEQECNKQGGEWNEKTATCYAKAPNVKLQVPIGLSKHVQSIGEYIKAIYQFAVRAAAILAAIMIMIGGFLWMTAAGKPERIKNAQSYIFGAVIGLLLALGSYVLLQTVNPKLTNIEPIKVPLIKKEETKKEPNKMQVGNFCWTKRDKKRCEAVCPGCYCHPITESTIEKIATAIIEASLATATVGVANLSSAELKAIADAGWTATKTGAKYIIKIPWMVLKTILTHPLKSLAVGTGTIITGDTIATLNGILGNSTGPDENGDENANKDKGERGFCYRDAVCEVALNGLCYEDKNCFESDTSECKELGKQGDRKCVITNDYGNVKWGFCSNGKNGSACNKDKDCKEGTKCIEVYNRNSKFCSDGKLGSLCANGTCEEGACDLDTHICTNLKGGDVGYPCNCSNISDDLEHQPKVCKDNNLRCEISDLKLYKKKNAGCTCIKPQSRGIGEPCSFDNTCDSCVEDNDGHFYETECSSTSHTCVWKHSAYDPDSYYPCTKK